MKRHSRIFRIEHYVQRVAGTLRITYEPELRPPWHGVIRSDRAKPISVSGYSKAEVVRGLTFLVDKR